MSSSSNTSFNKRIEKDLTGWRSFAIAMAALVFAFGLAIYSSAAAETGAVWTASASALGALGLAGWVAVTIVPALARRSPLRWLTFQMNYRVTPEGLVYLVCIFVVAIAALNTGNNLLFLILGCLLAGILLSGIVSTVTLAGIELKIELPEHVFAVEPARAVVELRNLKQMLPSFALRIVGEVAKDKNKTAPQQKQRGRTALLDQPLYFPFIPRGQSVKNRVELMFPRRGIYKQETLSLRSRFPFGFLEKSRKLPAKAEIAVYPSVEPTDEFFEILPLLSGELESYHRGLGHDLYAIRDAVSTDSARFVDWKASAKSGGLKVKEYAREEERRVLIALDPFIAASESVQSESEALKAAEKFERAVSFCACLAWHFNEIESVIGFRTPDGEVPLGPAAENVYDVLRQLAAIEPHGNETGRTFLRNLTNESHVFKIVITSQPRGSIPTALWSTSYIVFFDSL